ncbi:MAG: hypothetical protein ABIN44_07935 [Burkholderiaceae bacterium]
MVVVLMPMAGTGLFAMAMGAMARVMTLMPLPVFHPVSDRTFGEWISGAHAAR